MCKLTLAALEATLVHFINGDWSERIPFWAMASRPLESVRDEATRLVEALLMAGARATVVDTLAYVGSGSAPDEGLPSAGVRVSVPGIEAGELARRLRLGEPSVFVRLEGGAAIIDCRTLREGDSDLLKKAVSSLVC